jgi:hypothetical protein
MKRFLILLLAVALYAIPAHGALPQQTDARTDPVISGPISLADKECSKAAEKLDGQLVAYTRTCLRLYTFNPNQETDLQRDYGIAWLQTNVNAENGWCATTIRTDLRIPANVTIHRRNPRLERTTFRAKVATNKINTKAAGNSMETASVSQDYVFYPRKQVRSLVNEGATQRLTWFGSDKRKLFFETGVVFSWNILTSPGQFRSGLGFRFEKAANC